MRLFKRGLRLLRSHSFAFKIISSPFVMAKYLGINIPESIYCHLHHKNIFKINLPERKAIKMRGHNSLLENNLYWRGIRGFDYELLKHWMLFSKQSNACILDIGANTGYYALVAASMCLPSAHVYAFEPMKRIFLSLAENIKMNSFNNVTPLSLAVSNQTGTATLFDPGGDICYSASLKEGFRKHVSSQDVPVTTLDHFVKERSISKIDLIKIDVEAYESQVIEGFTFYLKEFKPKIFCEFSSKTKKDLVLSLLFSNGYCIYKVKGNRLQKIDKNGLGLSQMTDLNYVFIHSSDRLY